MTTTTKKTAYVVTGAFGHLGNTIINKLSDNYKSDSNVIIHGLALPNDNVMAYSAENVKIFRGNVCDPPSLFSIFSGLTDYEVIVIHTAGIVSIASKYEQRVYDVNVRGTKNVVEASLKHDVKRFIHVSSVHAIPDPHDGRIIREVNSFSKDNVHGLYAKTKAEATQYVLDSVKRGLNASVVHPSGIIGAGDFGHGHITQLIRDYINGSLVAGVKGGYDFVDVRDVADGIITCITDGEAGECYILSNRYVSIPKLLDMLHVITGKRKVNVVLPYWVAKATAPLSEMYYKAKKQPPLYTAYSLYTLHGNSTFSHEKATNTLNYHPRDIMETLRDTADWLTASQV